MRKVEIDSHGVRIGRKELLHLLLIFSVVVANVSNKAEKVRHKLVLVPAVLLRVSHEAVVELDVPPKRNLLCSDAAAAAAIIIIIIIVVVIVIAAIVLLH